LTGSIIADFTAAVELTNWKSGTSDRTRVLLSDKQLVFATDDARRAVALTEVFDIVQEVASKADPDATETVRIAFRVGEVREVALITSDVETLVRFQQVLYRELLDGTTVAVRHHRQKYEEMSSPTRLVLTATPSQIRFGQPEEEEDEATIVVPRTEVTAFKTAKETFAGEQDQPVVTLFSGNEGPPMKTVIGLPSFRLFNLFGRYLQATLHGPTSEPAHERPTEPIQVLLVDDNPDDLEMGELFLTQESDRLEIITATSAADGLKYLAENGTVDCVVSDYEMPGTDGLAFLQAVRDRYPNLPFILFTGKGGDTVAKQAILDDVTDYVEKNVGSGQYAVLAERIERAVR
jgi:CheY-like chemotaxis protein